MKIIVTGGSGFLGSALCLKLLELGHQVAYLSRSESVLLINNNVQWFKGDIADSDFVKKSCIGFDVVFHTAALAGYWGHYEDFYNVNVIGTKNVVSACQENKIKYLIHTSSPSIVFDNKDINGADESIVIPEKHLCYYSATKAIAERIVLDSNNENFKTLALRPHLIYGPGDNHLLPRVIRKIREGKMKIIGDGKNKVDMIYIDNAVMGHIQALESMLHGNACCGRSYFLSDDQPTELWSWVNKFAVGIQLKPITKKVPLSVAYFIGFVLEKFYRVFNINGEPPLTRFVAYSLGKSHYFNIANSKNLLKYRLAVAPEEALRRTIEYFKNYKH